MDEAQGKLIIVSTFAASLDTLEEEAKVLRDPDVELHARGPCVSPEQVLEAVRDADAGLCIWEFYTREVFEGAPKLKVVVRYGIGVDTVDLEAATEHGVIVAHLPDFCVQEVANHALALLLACCRKLLRIDRALRERSWAESEALWAPMGPLHGETLGLVAFGNTARALAKRARAMDMHVIAHDPYVASSVFAGHGVEPVSLEELAERADYVSCHAPLNQETRGMLDARFFGRMKETAYFINVSQGQVVNEADLIAALRIGAIAGAGLDVFESEPEPPSPDNPLFTMDNVVVTPHTAYYADGVLESRNRRGAQAALAVLRGGMPEFVANPDVLPARRV